MNIVRENLEDQTALLKVSVQEADYAENVDKALRAQKRKANVPGFRPGMVPMGIINKMFRKSVLADETYRLATNGAFDYIKENEMDIIGDLMPAEQQQPIDFDNQQDFEFIFQTGLAPEVKISLSKKNTIEKYDIQVDDEMISNYRSSFFRRHGNLVDADQIEAEDAVSFTLMNDDTKIEDAYIGLGNMAEEQRAPFLGKKVGDKMEININELYPIASQRAAILTIKEEDLANIDPEFTLEITKIRRFADPELNDAFFAEAFPDGSVKNTDDFENKIATEVKAELETQTEFKFTEQVRDYMLSKMELPLPEEFLRNWLFQANEGKFTMEDIDKEFPQFLQMMRWDLVKREISKENNLEVTPEELKEEAKRLAMNQFRYYGMSTVADDMLENYSGEILKNQDEARRLYDKIAEGKVVDAITEKVSIKTREMSVKEFAEMMNTNVR